MRREVVKQSLRTGSRFDKPALLSLIFLKHLDTSILFLRIPSYTEVLQIRNYMFLYVTTS